MKYILVFIFLLVSPVFTNAQPTSAQDWTKTDCDGNPHHLFSYLDSNHVAVMLFEMGCSGCVAGARALEVIKESYDISDPGKVHFFAMDYWVGHSCTTDVDSFVINNNLSYPGFDHCMNEKNYYTSASPMPMIIVSAGTSHSLFYFSISYAPNDSLPIFNAIDSALTYVTAEINDLKKISSVQLFPNPATNETTLSFSLTSEVMVNIEITNLLGEQIKLVANENKFKGIRQYKINTQQFSKGIYFISINSGEESSFLKFIVE